LHFHLLNFTNSAFEEDVRVARSRRSVLILTCCSDKSTMVYG